MTTPMPPNLQGSGVSKASGPILVTDCGRISYAQGLRLQEEHVEAVLAVRSAQSSSQHEVGHLLVLEHEPPVITISRRKGADRHLVATAEALKKLGVEIATTDRGGDITYHGPGQLVAYPILDLNRLGLNLHAYIRLLERVVIDLCLDLGVSAHRDIEATGVWVGGEPASLSGVDRGGRFADGRPVASGGAKLCALGVRVKRWVTLHGLALNVTTNLDHFKLIVPCGLAGRPVTNLRQQLGDACPSMDSVKRALAQRLGDEAASLLGR